MHHFTASVLYVVVLFLASPWVWAASSDISSNSDRTILPGHVLSALSIAQPVTAPVMVLKSTLESLTLTIVLRRSDPAGFENYLRDVYDPQSPQFREFLNPQEVSDRFGPSQDDYDVVQAYFEQQGFTVTEDSVNRMTLTVAGTRSTAESALSVKINDYVIGERQFFANINEPMLPAEIARRVQAVSGLSSLAVPRPQIIRTIRIIFGAVICDLEYAAIYGGLIVAASNVANGKPLTQEQLKKIQEEAQKWLDKCVHNAVFAAYGLPIGNDPPPPAWQGTDGTGQTIGLLEFDTFNPNDVSDFIHLVGLPASTFNNISQVHVNGGAGPSPGSDQDEVLMDINAVLLIAPGAKIVVYDGPFSGANVSFQALFNAMINGGVHIISNSWSYCEDQTTLADVQSIDAILQSAAASGISVFNGSGDTGSTCLDGAPNTIGVPSDSPSATAVGGTSLTVGPGNTYISEAWWNGTNDTPPSGQGGYGVSKFFSRPSYQDGFNPSVMRSVPDVAANADPAHGILICKASEGGCPTGTLNGGTSLAAPAWAAFAALLNQSQGSNLGALNPQLYPLGNTDAFHNASSMGSDFAHVGLGSPNLPNLHRHLTNQTVGPTSSSVSEVRVFSDSNSTMPAGSDFPLPIYADGSTKGSVVVRLADAFGNVVSGKNVTLAASAGSHALITPASGVSDVDNGSVVFTVTNLSFEEVTFTATDISDGIVISQTAKVAFIQPPAASASISASPTSLLNDGASATTITVTLKDALDRPSPGKSITLSQGSGRSVITGPSPSVTDVNGQIQFTATNQLSEIVTYTAVDVTDGDLPVPGAAVVTFSGSANLSCVGNPPTAAAGYALTPFANGFFTQNLFFGNVNWGCSGASNPTFNTTNSVYVANFASGDLFQFGLDGGVVSTGNKLSNLGLTLGQPTFGKDGRLYATHGATTGNFTTGNIVEIDPVTGAQLRVIAANLTCPSSLSVDPLSGDLFFDNACTGAGSDNPSLFRVRNPGGATPTVEVYATLPTTMGNGAISFAPDGSIYVVINYFGNPSAPIVRVSGTDQPSPTITILPGITSNYWVTVGEVNPDGSAKSLIVLAPSGLALVDLTTNTSTPLTNGGIGSGVIGPDGCLYATATDTIYKLTPSSGGCGFAATNPAPTLILSPATVSPDPEQGSLQTFSTQFVNLAVPADTPVYFHVGGANAQSKLSRTDANGKATITYRGDFVGSDTVTANATVDAASFTSNAARLTWGVGKHTTFLSLNTSPTSSITGMSAMLVAGLIDASANPTAAIAGAAIQFSVGGQSCNGTTNASGIASCTVTLPTAGSFVLTANYVGTAQFVPSSASQSFFVVAPIASPPICFTGALTSGGQATACLPSGVPPTCQFVNSAFVPVASIGVAPPAGIQIPYDLFQFTATGCGNSISLSLTYPAALPASASYWKFGPTTGQPAHWYALPAAVNGSTLTVVLTDGGAGDSDLQQNGSIVDPGGVGFAVGADGAPIPTLDEWRLALLVLLMATILGVVASRPQRTGRFQ